MTEIAFRPAADGKPPTLTVDGVEYLPATAVDLDALALQRAAEQALNVLHGVIGDPLDEMTGKNDPAACERAAAALEQALLGVQYAAPGDVDVIADRCHRYVTEHGPLTTDGGVTPLALQLLNVAEEAAELAAAASRAVLKRQQGIRQGEDLLSEVWKEIGDVVFSSTLAVRLAGKQPSAVILARIEEIERRGPDARTEMAVSGSTSTAPPSLPLPAAQAAPPLVPDVVVPVTRWIYRGRLQGENESRELHAVLAKAGDRVPVIQPPDGAVVDGWYREEPDGSQHLAWPGNAPEAFPVVFPS